MIERKPLRAQVQREILARIADGRLPAAARINESRLATELGVSRTPLREAMLGLEAAGILASDMGRGFVLPELTGARFREVCDVLASLAPAALRAAWPLPGGRLMELQNLLGRARLQATTPGPAAAAALGDLVGRWSALACAGCPNRVLTGEIGRLEALAGRGWRAAAAGGFAPAEMLGSYAELYELMRSGRGEAAADRWEEHIRRFSGAAAAFLPARAADS